MESRVAPSRHKEEESGAEPRGGASTGRPWRVVESVGERSYTKTAVYDSRGVEGEGEWWKAEERGRKWLRAEESGARRKAEESSPNRDRINHIS